MPTIRRRKRRTPAGSMTVLEHLAELRNRLMWIFGAVGLAAVPGWTLYETVVELLLEPARPYLPDGRLIFTGPMDAFTLRFRIALYIGFSIAFPVVLYHVWRFVAPGLKAQEKKYVIPFIVSGMLLFCLGLTSAYFTLPQALEFLIGPVITGPEIVPLLAARQYLDFMLMYLFAFGLTFQFPIVLMFLTLTRVLTSKQLARYRRHVLVGISIVVALATPSVDLITMGVLTAALYLLYESCIWLSKLLKR